MPQEWKTRQDLLEQFEASLKKGREVLLVTTDDRLLNTKWRLLVVGNLMGEETLCRGAQPHGPSSWTADSVPATERCEGPRDLRSISR